MTDKDILISDLNDISEILNNNGYGGWCNTIQKAIAMLKEQETANLYKCPNCGTWVSAENVVRCKDCKHGYQLYDDYISCEISEENESGCHLSHKPEWFCADGKRRE